MSDVRLVKCLCGTTVDVGFAERCHSCGLYFRGLKGEDGGKYPTWGVRPGAKLRPDGNQLILSGIALSAIGAATYTLGFFLPATLTTTLSDIDKILDRVPVTTVNMWRPALLVIGGALFGVGPIVWATGQILRAISWLPREPEPEPVIAPVAEPSSTTV